MESESQKQSSAKAALYKKITKDEVRNLLWDYPFSCQYQRKDDMERQDYDGCEQNLMMMLDDRSARVKELDVDHPEYDASCRKVFMTVSFYNGPVRIYLTFQN